MNHTPAKFFKKNGYCIINLFNNEIIENIKQEVNDKLNSFCKELNNNLKLKNLKNYHKLKITENDHKYFVKNSSRYIKLNSKIIKKIKLNKKFVNILKNFWGHSNTSITWVGSLEKKNSIKKNATAFRIAKPKPSSDVGGVHYDLPYGRQKVPNKDHKALVTIWCPLVGFSEKYTLKISPKSHIPKHSLSKILKQKKFLSPVFDKNYVKKFKYMRPRLKKGQAIIFHPNLLHGASYNRGNNTRVSLDLRIFNSKKVKF